jgi:hypothetical protein
MEGEDSMKSGRVTRLERATAETLQEARRDIAVEILNSVLKSICALFLEVNDEPDPQERIDRFAMGTDKIVDDYLMPLCRSWNGMEGDDQQQKSSRKA